MGKGFKRPAVSVSERTRKTAPSVTDTYRKVEDLVKFTFLMPRSTRAALKKYAAAHETTITEVLLGLINDLLEGKK